MRCCMHMRRLALVLTLALAAPAHAATDCLRTAGGLDLQTATVSDLQQAMAAGRLSSEALVANALDRIAAYDRSGPAALNSIRAVHPGGMDQARQRDAERRMGRVRGPLHGIPVVLKDNVGTRDLPTTAGSLALEGTVPPSDATIVARLRDAGAVILAKSNLSEFANWVDLSMPNGYSSLGGQVRNAYDLGDPLGSSSGSGVAMSMAFGSVAIGTETSGSIISPSYVNGIVGVKPTHGLLSTDGIIPLAPQFDVPGPMARSVTDAAHTLGVLSGRDETPMLRRDALRGARLAYASGADDDPLFAASLERLRAQGAETVPTGTLDAGIVGVTEIGVIPNAFKASLNAYLQTVTPLSGVRTLADIIAFNERHPDRVKYGQNLLVASDATPGIGPLADGQALPTIVSARAVIEAALIQTGADAIVGQDSANVNLGAAAGHPTVIVPSAPANRGRTQHGLAFLGRRLDEPRLLGYAYAFEQAGPARIPPTDVNSRLIPQVCPPPAPGVRLTRRGRVLVVRVTHARPPVVVTVRRAGRTVARRTLRATDGTVRIRVRRRGRHTVTVRDAGGRLLRRTVRV